jgi:hypothetical protein
MKKVNFLTKKKEIFTGLLLMVLVGITIWGFVFKKQHPPIRIAFATKGGGVIFDHQYHASLKDLNCDECHHGYSEGERHGSVMNCRKCHYSKENIEICQDESIHKRCIGKNCTDCHTRDSVSCEFCHNAEYFKKMEEPKEIKFETDGGLVIFNHLNHRSPDTYDIECETCHHGYKPEIRNHFPMNCRRCHYNKKYEKICEKNDVHVRCIGNNCLECHTDGKDDCSICHKEE